MCVLLSEGFSFVLWVLETWKEATLLKWIHCLCEATFQALVFFLNHHFFPALWSSLRFLYVQTASSCFSAAAWCSVNKAWAWTDPTRHQDSWTPTFRPSPGISPLLLTSLTSLQTSWNNMFTQCKCMVAVTIEQSAFSKSTFASKHCGLLLSIYDMVNSLIMVLARLGVSHVAWSFGLNISCSRNPNDSGKPFWQCGHFETRSKCLQESVSMETWVHIRSSFHIWSRSRREHSGNDGSSFSCCCYCVEMATHFDIILTSSCADQIHLYSSRPKTFNLILP